MNRSVFNDNDRRQMLNLGIQEEKAISQIEMLKKGTPYMKLDRPCRIGDGIKVVSEEEFKKFITIYESSAGIKRLIKFVPASGAATRMLKELIYISNKYEKIERDFFVLNSLYQLGRISNIAGAEHKAGIENKCIKPFGRIFLNFDIGQVFCEHIILLFIAGDIPVEIESLVYRLILIIIIT